nr:hypothetical protein [Bacteroidota bacterium]
MNVHAKKLELVQLILNTNEPLILKKIEEVFSRKRQDWWDEISDDEKAAIKKGLAEAENGELIPHADVMKDIRGKYNVKSK